jgi:hypothetical protein
METTATTSAAYLIESGPQQISATQNNPSTMMPTQHQHNALNSDGNELNGSDNEISEDVTQRNSSMARSVSYYTTDQRRHSSRQELQEIIGKCHATSI